MSRSTQQRPAPLQLGISFATHPQQAERTLLAVLEGGCSVPVGALASHGRLRGCVAAIDGSRVIVAEAVDDDPVALGNEVARKLLEQGAREILDG